MTYDVIRSKGFDFELVTDYREIFTQEVIRGFSQIGKGHRDRHGSDRLGNENRANISQEAYAIEAAARIEGG